MTISGFNRSVRLFTRFAGILILIMLWSGASPAAAQEKTDDSALPAAQAPIRVTADKLITDTQNKTAEFIGHVSVTQDDTTITSDKLTVYYKDTAGSNPSASTDTIVRIVAQKNVKIIMDDQVAHTQHAEYIAAQKIMILTGAGSKIISGNNSISGHKITLFREDGRMHVAGTANEPVEAFFYSNEKGLVPTKKQ